MKKLMMLIVLLASMNSFAGVAIKEYDQAKEVACYSEIKAMGCVDKDGQENTKCVDSGVGKLSSGCQALHKEKKNK